MRSLCVCSFLLLASLGRFPLQALSLPIVDPGVFIIQGIATCDEGRGYCMLGNDCSADIDFKTAEAGQHCDGLKEAFTPPVHFTCCAFNARGKATSEAPTTVLSSFTITDVQQFLQEEIPILDYQETNEIPADVDPASLINIVGVITDMTGVLGLVTEPYRGTVPSLTTASPTTTASTTTTTTTTTSTPKVDEQRQSNVSHASISLADILNRLRATTTGPINPKTSPGSTPHRTEISTSDSILTTTSSSTHSISTSTPSSVPGLGGTDKQSSTSQNSTVIRIQKLAPVNARKKRYNNR